MIVSANIASCTPAEPITAGPRILKKRRMAGSRRGVSIRGATPSALCRDTQTSSSSRTPATATPQAAAWPAVGNRKASARADDQRDVEQDGRRGGGGEALMGVEHAPRGSSPA